MAAIFDAIRSAMGGETRPTGPTGYQPSELAIRSLSSVSDKHGLSKAMSGESGLWPGESCVSPSPSSSKRQPEILLGGPPEVSVLSMRSRGQQMASYRSVPEDRPFSTPFDDVASLPAPGCAAVRRTPSIASSLPERIPSFKTDMDSFADSEALTEALQSGLPSNSNHQSMEAPGLGLGITSAPGAPAPRGLRPGERPCDKWLPGSVVEVYSASAGRWYPAEVGQVEGQGGGQEDIVTVVFYLGDEMKQKSVYRTDKALAVLGTHTFSELPPGFETRASQSKPGQLVYLDLTTCTKYASLELAWQVHFQRLKQLPAAGCETVAAVPAARPAPLAPRRGAVNGGSVPPVMEEDELKEDSGKVALPSFGDELGSQGAYLDYVGAPLAAANRYGKENPMAAGYQVIHASAPQRPIKIRNVDPALQTWQDDAFSEWRR